MLLALSHTVLTASDVPRMVRFFSLVSGLSPYFSNEQFAEFVLPSGHRLAFFRAVGAAAKYFQEAGQRHHVSHGVTTPDVQALYDKVTSEELIELGVQVSGPPKDHPWGEKSFLMIDPEGNRWEVTQSPTEDGRLLNRE